MKALPGLFISLGLLACTSQPEGSSPANAPLEVTETGSGSSSEAGPTYDPPKNLATLPVPDAASSTSTEDADPHPFWIDPQSHAAQAAARRTSLQTREAVWLRKLAEQPTAIWLTPQTNALAEAQRLAEATKGTQRYGVAVIHGLPKRDCAQFTSPGLAPADYRRWLQMLAQTLSQTPMYWILEPGALLLTSCLGPQEIKDRLNLLAESVLILKKNQGSRVYLDGGYPGWLTADDAAQKLVQAGVLTADGFALNIGQYHGTAACLDYGHEIAKRLGGKGFVLDTSRNGRSVSGREGWCNPRNRAIGERPQAPTHMKGLDAYLWLKSPGDSDGSCNGGPAAGQWWEARAIEMMRNAELPH